MDNNQMLEFIRTSKANGVTDESIRAALRLNGVAEDEMNALIGASNVNDTLPVTGTTTHVLGVVGMPRVAYYAAVFFGSMVFYFIAPLLFVLFPLGMVRILSSTFILFAMASAISFYEFRRVYSVGKSESLSFGIKPKRYIFYPILILASFIVLVTPILLDTGSTAQDAMAAFLFIMFGTPFIIIGVVLIAALYEIWILKEKDGSLYNLRNHRFLNTIVGLLSIIGLVFITNKITSSASSPSVADLLILAVAIIACIQSLRKKKSSLVSLVSLIMLIALQQLGFFEWLLVLLKI